MTWINVTGDVGITNTLPSPLDYRCFEPAAPGSCRSRVAEFGCQDGEGRVISYGKGSKCKERCATNYGRLVGRRSVKWNIFSPKWKCGGCSRK
jgi:hypothetical protein